jgi:flagellar biogenesis protein FliO
MDAIEIARYLGALVLVLGLLGMAWVAARKYGLPGIVAPNGARRLAVVETLMLDARHKAYLIRRDDTEHLVIIGPQGTATVETGMPHMAEAARPALEAVS